jgi:predicted ATPase
MFMFRRTLAAAGIGAYGAFSVSHMRDDSHGDSIFHRVDPNLMRIGLAKVPGTVSRQNRNRPGETHVVRTALTGGPCAGKSSALKRLTEVATAAGFDVYTAPEGATVLFNAGTDPSLMFSTKDMGFTFQTSLLRLQLTIERSLTAIAASTGRPSIIIFDRGLLDSKGYMTPEDWTKLLELADARKNDAGVYDNQGISEEYCLRRYDGVIHMVTAADGARKFYKQGTVKDDSGNDVVRKESPEEAVVLDKKMQECWNSHPNHVVVPNNSAGFDAKLNSVANAVVSMAKTSHPQE